MAESINKANVSTSLSLSLGTGSRARQLYRSLVALIPIINGHEHESHEAWKVYPSHRRVEFQRWYFDSQPLPSLRLIHIRRKSSRIAISNSELTQSLSISCFSSFMIMLACNSLIAIAYSMTIFTGSSLGN